MSMMPSQLMLRNVSDEPAFGLRLRRPSLLGSADYEPLALHNFDEFSVVPKRDDSEAPQMNMPNLGITNPAWMADNPLYTLTTEFTTLLTLQSQAGFDALQMVAIRDRLGANVEFGAFGSFGTSTGSAGLSLHLGPQAPKADAVARGFGFWGTLSQTWGQEPPRPWPQPGWSFNPTANALFAYSWQRPNKWGFDIVGGSGASRWGQVNNVPVGGFLTPFAGVNYSRNLSDTTVLNFEGTIGANIGAAGRFDTGDRSRLPTSRMLNIGVGVQHMWGDYGIGVEPWFFWEEGNVNSAGGPFGNYGGGIRFGFGAINPRREHVE